MSSRDLVKKALDFELLDEIPTERDDVWGPSYIYGPGKSSGEINKKGSRTDVWGCVWEAAEDGVCGEVKYSPLEDWSALDSFQPPWDVLKEADLSMVNRSCEESSKFMIPMWDASCNPFERLQHLRSPQNLLMDLGYGDIEIYKLRDMVHEYYMKQLEMWVNTDVDGIHIADDWGTQKSLLISPRTWREFFKPLYKDYCDLAHSKGKYVVMHSDGYIADIIPDLVEIGVNALNSQLFCMDIDKIAEMYHGRIAFWGEIDRQFALPLGTVEDVRAAVRKVANAFFKYKRTGIVGQCFWGKDIPQANIDVVYSEWKKV